MSDQCKNCQVRGDYEKCIETPCFRHESWIDLQRIEKTKELEKEVKRLKVTMLIYAREEIDVNFYSDDEDINSDDKALEYFNNFYVEHGGR